MEIYAFIKKVIHINILLINYEKRDYFQMYFTKCFRMFTAMTNGHGCKHPKALTIGKDLTHGKYFIHFECPYLIGDHLHRLG